MRTRVFSISAVLAVAGLLSAGASASVPVRGKKLADQLTSIRTRVMSLQQNLLDSLHTQSEVKSNLKKIRALMKLQHEERDLGTHRIGELERTIGELEARRGVLRERIGEHQKLIRKSLADIARSVRAAPNAADIPEIEKLEAPRRKLLANLAERELKEIETYRADLADADQLQARIVEEQQQLAYLLQELKEQESVLELNRQLQADILQQKFRERISQLDHYRKLKSSEAQVERLITDFNARIELEKSVEAERVVSKAMMQGAFARLKGVLPMPVKGDVVSFFGRAFDPKSKLSIFHKGIEIAAGKKEAVAAVSSGRLAFTGELPGYGRVAIVDHGDHFYSLVGNLGEIRKKVGEPVARGEVLGATDDAGAPVYFEIRARNIAVNPLQWLTN